MEFSSLRVGMRLLPEKGSPWQDQPEKCTYAEVISINPGSFRITDGPHIVDGYSGYFGTGYTVNQKDASLFKPMTRRPTIIIVEE